MEVGTLTGSHYQDKDTTIRCNLVAKCDGMVPRTPTDRVSHNKYYQKERRRERERGGRGGDIKRG